MTKPVGKLRIAERTGKYTFRGTRVADTPGGTAEPKKPEDRRPDLNRFSTCSPPRSGHFPLSYLPASVRPTSARTSLPPIRFGHIDQGNRSETHRTFQQPMFARTPLVWWLSRESMTIRTANDENWVIPVPFLGGSSNGRQPHP